ncbi:proteoglycan 4 [Salvelinus sp. IW2-2015]|uniref:proteoglycan 4 n=1 Tax=Salvelinus sp. IW2-2015 TaxID=2691554 RepID=UPI0038D3E9C4
MLMFFCSVSASTTKGYVELDIDDSSTWFKDLDSPSDVGEELPPLSPPPTFATVEKENKTANAVEKVEETGNPVEKVEKTGNPVEKVEREPSSVPETGEAVPQGEEMHKEGTAESTLLDTESPFKKHAPIKTSSPIKRQERDEDKDRTASPLLLICDDDDDHGPVKQPITALTPQCNGQAADGGYDAVGLSSLSVFSQQTKDASSQYAEEGRDTLEVDSVLVQHRDRARRASPNKPVSSSRTQRTTSTREEEFWPTTEKKSLAQPPEKKSLAQPPREEESGPTTREEESGPTTREEESGPTTRRKVWPNHPRRRVWPNHEKKSGPTTREEESGPTTREEESGPTTREEESGPTPEKKRLAQPPEKEASGPATREEASGPHPRRSVWPQHQRRRQYRKGKPLSSFLQNPRKALASPVREAPLTDLEDDFLILEDDGPSCSPFAGRLTPTGPHLDRSRRTNHTAVTTPQLTHSPRPANREGYSQAEIRRDS